MKWFKHENTFNNPKIEILTERCGIIGYGVYFMILELISNSIEESNIDEWGYLPKVYDESYLAKKLKVSPDQLTHILNTCFELELFTNQNGVVFCPKILERCDDYTQRLIKQSSTKKKQSRNKVGTSSVQSPTKNRIEEEENRIDKTRLEEKRIDASPHILLKDLDDSDFTRISELYKVPIPFVRSKYDDLVNWHGKSPNKNHYQNYYRGLCDWVKRDAIKLRKEEEHGGRLVLINPE